MKNIDRKSLIIFGYSEMLTIGLVVNSKLNKVKKFNIFEDDNEDEFFKVISRFISNKIYFNSVYYSCGPGGFTIIRKIISYVKALSFKDFANTKFIGLNNLFIIAYHLIYKCEINDQGYIISILNHSNDKMVQIFQKKKNSTFLLQKLSDINNMDLDLIENYLKTFNLSIQNVHVGYLGANPNLVSFFNNIEIVEGSKILETIVQISFLVENNKISQTDFKNFFEEKFDPLYGKSPSTN